MTFGVLYEPRAHARSKGFIDRIPAAYEAAERSEGFIARSHLDPNFKRPFDAQGNPMRMDPELTRRIAARNTPISHERQ